MNQRVRTAPVVIKVTVEVNTGAVGTSVWTAIFAPQAVLPTARYNAPTTRRSATD